MPSAPPRCATSSTFPAGSRPPAEIVTLERNYRSTEPILAAANAVIGAARERFTKKLWTERTLARRGRRWSRVRDEADQARYVCDRVLEEREAGTALKEQAVLFRTSHHSGPLEVELTRRNIPFVKFGGLKFLDAAHVKDVLAVLRFAENPRDRVAGFRVLQLLPGIGPGSGRAPARRSRRGDRRRRCARRRRGAGAVPRRTGRPFAALYSELRRQARLAGRARARCASGTSRILERLHEDAAMRRADLLQLEQIAAGYASRERFLTELTLDPPDATSDRAGPPHRDEDYLILSTIHSAKGQEWKNVFVLNCVDGCIPVRPRHRHQRGDRGGAPPALRGDDARQGRACTSSCRSASTCTARRRAATRHVYAARTRFIEERMLGTFEQVAWPAAVSFAARAAEPQRRVDLKGRMLGMWR